MMHCFSSFLKYSLGLCFDPHFWRATRQAALPLDETTQKNHISQVLIGDRYTYLRL